MIALLLVAGTTWINPMPDADYVVRYGEALYDTYCERCHGEYADGLGPDAWGLNPMPGDLRDLKQDDAALFVKISAGSKAGMPSFKDKLKEAQVGAVIRFLEHLPTPERVPDDPRIGHAPTPTPTPLAKWQNPMPDSEDVALYGAGLYKKHCQICHGETADGKGPAAPGFTPPPADLRKSKKRDPKRLYTAIRIGKPGTGMPAYGNALTEAELGCIVRYLQKL